MRRTIWSGALALAAMAAASGAQAQDTQEEVLPTISITFNVGNAVGDLSEYFDRGFGAQLSGFYPLEEMGIARIRADIGFLVYGVERQRHCFPVPIGCRINAEVQTTNSIGYGGVGPEFGFPMGAIEPYVYGTIGLSVFWTESSLVERTGEDYLDTTHLADGNFAWRAGGGVRVRLTQGRSPVALNFAVERHDNGVAEFLTKGDIVDHTDGRITLRSNRSQADLVTLRIGVTIGIRGN